MSRSKKCYTKRNRIKKRNSSSFFSSRFLALIGRAACCLFATTYVQTYVHICIKLFFCISNSDEFVSVTFCELLLTFKFLLLTLHIVVLNLIDNDVFYWTLPLGFFFLKFFFLGFQNFKVKVEKVFVRYWLRTFLSDLF